VSVLVHTSETRPGRWVAVCPGAATTGAIRAGALAHMSIEGQKSMGRSWLTKVHILDGQPGLQPVPTPNNESSIGADVGCASTGEPPAPVRPIQAASVPPNIGTGGALGTQGDVPPSLTATPTVAGTAQPKESE